MNKYQAISISREDRLFAERYVVSATTARQAFQRALVKDFMQSGVAASEKEALKKAKDCLWSLQKCTGGTEQIWSGENDMSYWVLTRLGRPAKA
jgi:hypothetical protein